VTVSRRLDVRSEGRSEEILETGIRDASWLRYHDIGEMVSIPLMTAVVPVDRAGRIVIPKETRDAQGIAPGTKFLLIEGKDGSLWLQRLDPQELARRIHEELQGIDLAPLVAKVEAEIDALAASKYPSAARR